MTKEFIGRVAFVTGGTGGIGSQICRDLANEGASVVVADLKLKPAQEFAASLPTGDGREHLGLELDVSNKSEVENAVALIQKKYGRPADLIVNNAGIADGQALILDIKEADFDRVVKVNFKGTFLVSQAFGRALIDAKTPGAIVNVSSAFAYHPKEKNALYGGSKAAVQQFTKVAAKEWGPKGIRVNSVHPGLIETPMTAAAIGGNTWKSYEQTASLRRVGQPKDVSNTILYLLSERSGFITGEGIEISGQGY